MRRVESMFQLTVPPIVALAATYVGLADAVFGLHRVLGDRMQRGQTRVWVWRTLRAAYLLLQAAVALGLHAALGAWCFTSETCTAEPLKRKWCLVAASVSILVVATSLAVDRCAVPLLDLRATPSYQGGFASRLFNAALVCVAWMCLAEGETLGIALLLAATGRRALFAFPRAGSLYVNTIKCYTLAHTGWVLNHMCRSASRRMPVAVLGAILMV